MEERPRGNTPPPKSSPRHPLSPVHLPSSHIYILIMSERQSSLDQTLTSVISLLENEQTLKKVRHPTLREKQVIRGWVERKEDREERSEETVPGEG